LLFLWFCVVLFLHRLNKQNPTVIVYIHVYKVYTVKVDIFKSEHIHNTSNYTDSYCKNKTTQNHKNNNNYNIRALKV